MYLYFLYTSIFGDFIYRQLFRKPAAMPLSDAQMQKHASAFAKCSASLCKANEKADDAVWKAAPDALEAKTAKKLSKDTSLKLMLDMVNAVKNSIERLNMVGRA